MKLFDGTNLSSIAKSLSKAFGVPAKQVPNLIKSYLLLNMQSWGGGNLSLQDFFEDCKKSRVLINTPTPQFDRVIFFHKTSLIDKGVFLREKGLLDLDEMLRVSSPLSEYLKKKGVEFFIKDKIPFICINGIMQPLEDLPCTKTESSKRRIVNRLTKKDLNLEGITGFLFLCDMKNNTTYQRIDNTPEFLLDLDGCIDGIVDEWRSISSPAILQCEVDIESWFRPGDIGEQENNFEKSYEIAQQGFLCLAEVYGQQYIPRIKFRPDDYYPFIAHGFGVPPDRIIKTITRS